MNMIPIKDRSKLLKMDWKRSSKNNRTYYKKTDSAIYFFMNRGGGFEEYNMLTMKPYNSYKNNDDVKKITDSLYENKFEFNDFTYSDFYKNVNYCNNCKINIDLITCHPDYEYCSKICKLSHIENTSDICQVCFTPIYHNTINHHIEYFPEKIISVHSHCHNEIHKSWNHSHLRPVEGESKRFYSLKPSLCDEIPLCSPILDIRKMINKQYYIKKGYTPYDESKLVIGS